MLPFCIDMQAGSNLMVLQGLVKRQAVSYRNYLICS